jgi:hypothetical protein
MQPWQIRDAYQHIPVFRRKNSRIKVFHNNLRYSIPADRKITVAVPIGMPPAWRGIGILIPGFVGLAA